VTVKTVGLDKLRRHLAYTLTSGFVKNKKRPLSTLILANPERAKSTEVNRFDCLGAFVMNDLTAYGLEMYLNNLSEKDRRSIHHLIIPDLERISARSKTVKHELLASLRVFMDEGMSRKQTQRIRIEWNDPVQLGVVVCTTPQDLGDKRSAFRSVSLQSRFIPFSYDYSSKGMIRVMDFIEDEETAVRKKEYIKREEPATVFCPDSLKKRLTMYAGYMARRAEKFSYIPKASTPMTESPVLIGIRAKENLITYLQSIALRNGSTRVTTEHFAEFEELYEYMNYKFKEIF
jgi:hypothetical protein